MFLFDNRVMEKYEDVIKKIKQGDKEAYNTIYEDHKKMIYKIISYHSNNCGDFTLDTESLFQEGCLALYKAVFTYEPDKGMSFSSYAFMAIKSRINTYIKRIRKNNSECLSLDAMENIDHRSAMSSLYVSENPVAYHREIEFRHKLHEFTSKLSKEDKMIFELRQEELSYKEISERLNINTKRVDNRLRVLRKKLKKFLENKQ